MAKESKALISYERSFSLVSLILVHHLLQVGQLPNFQDKILLIFPKSTTLTMELKFISQAPSKLLELFLYDQEQYQSQMLCQIVNSNS
jgi:hypothetical protein